MTIATSRERALQVLCMADPAQKAAQTRALFAAIAQLPTDADAILVEPDTLPGRPALPRLVPPKDVPTRSPFTPEGRAALLHAIAHIEFNAINIALLWSYVTRPGYHRMKRAVPGVTWGGCQ